MNKTAIAITILLTSMPLNAAIYKWVDEQGEIHYSQSPPKQQSATRMNIRSLPTATASSEPATDADQAPVNNQQTNEPDQSLVQQKINQAELEKQCQSARESLATLQQDKRVYTVDGQGERHYVDDKERAARIARLQQDIKKYCH